MFKWNDLDYEGKYIYVSCVLNIPAYKAFSKIVEMDLIASNNNLTIVMDCDLNKDELKEWEEECLLQDNTLSI